jgi:NADH dehydrogenase FAD-containing subunit
MDRKQEIEGFLSKLSSAVDASDHDVVVVGGGLVGVELMGEIVHRLKSRKNQTSSARLVLLSRSKLLDTLPAAAGQLASSWLRKRGVEVLEQDEILPVDNSSDISTSSAKDLTTKQGKTIRPSILIDCTGLPPPGTSQPTAPDGLENLFSSRGYVAVDEHLQVSAFIANFAS